MFVWLTWLSSPWLEKQKEKRKSPRWQLDFLITLSEQGWRASVLSSVAKGRRQLLIVIQQWFGETQWWAIIIADELTWFYLSVEGFSLRWLSVGLVRHVCSWGNGLIQCWGHGTEDLSQSSESLWSHRLLLKDLSWICPSVCLSFPTEIIKKKKNSLVAINVFVSGWFVLVECNNRRGLGERWVRGFYWEENVFFIRGDNIVWFYSASSWTESRHLCNTSLINHSLGAVTKIFIMVKRLFTSSYWTSSKDIVRKVILSKKLLYFNK